MIGINAVLLSPFSGGISTYITNLISQLEKMTSSKEMISIFLSKDQYVRYKRSFNFSSIKTPFSSKNPYQRVIMENLYWNRLLKKNSINLFHSPISYIPYNLSNKSIVTIHDLRVFVYPETYYFPRAHFLKRAIQRSVYNASKIISVSEFTKNDILNRFDVPEEKIKVVYEGIDSKRFSSTKQNDDELILKKYKIGENFLFTLGHLEPRKNYLRLIQAFEILLNNVKEPIELVIGGQKGFDYKQIIKYVVDNNLQQKINFTGFIEHNDLPVLYRNANAFIMPSMYEGFGFPPLESLVSGVPVAVSNRSSLPEILGDAALYFDPLNIEEMAEKMDEIIYDENTRNDILKNRNNTIAKYKWKTCAEETYKLYNDTMNA